MRKFEGNYDKEYKKLNHAQRKAVDAIDGPVMVVAGPGTGKTQILALRIGNILRKTDIKADGILCLTFTNSAVDAMRKRLVNYIGEDGEKVNVFTFHSFGLKLIEKHFKVLGMKEVPKLLEDTATPVFFDEILNSQRWKYLRPRGDSSRYFKDLKSLISLLKRSRISIKEFSESVDEEVKSIKSDEGNVSSRGSRKGELKKEAEESIERLEKSREVAEFLEVYEKKKKEGGVIDYDDVLEGMVKIVEESEDALNEIQERYLYILVDEHQDSSLVQNEFLAKVWGELEKPDIFVVGDDRQLIYGFSGASIDHFKGFQKTFSKAKLIPLLQNYRSTQVILDAAHNAESCRALVSAVENIFPERRVNLVLSVSQDKDKRNICHTLNKIAQRVIITKTNHPRCSDFSSHDLHEYFGDKEIIRTNNTSEAYARAAHVSVDDDIVVVTGSVFVVSEMRKLCTNRP